jgi:hypothetical protein
MPGNLKNGARKAESAIGLTNNDLTRTSPPADPRFQPEREKPAEDEVPRLGISGKGADAKIAVPHQRLPDRPAPRAKMAFEVPPRKRT